MAAIPDEKLFSYGDRVQGKVVLITGAANGFGRETAIQFAARGARVVIGDLDEAGGRKVVSEIESKGGEAVALRCDVTNWDDQVALFQLAMEKYKAVDIVVPNAGVTEIGSFQDLQLVNGRPQKPVLKTLEINLNAVLYTAHLAVHYLQVGKKDGDLKALIFIGSIASWLGIPKGEIYTASKHAVLGVMRGLHPILELKGIRVGCIHPFFADTNIVPAAVKLLLAGIPLVPIPRVAGAIFYAATDPNWDTNGSAWMLLDDGPVFLVPREEFKMGVYKMIDDRANAGKNALQGIRAWVRFFSDIGRILRKPLFALASVGLLVAFWPSILPYLPIGQ